MMLKFQHSFTPLSRINFGYPYQNHLQIFSSIQILPKKFHPLASNNSSHNATFIPKRSLIFNDFVKLLHFVQNPRLVAIFITQIKQLETRGRVLALVYCKKKTRREKSWKILSYTRFSLTLQPKHNTIVREISIIRNNRILTRGSYITRV